VTSAALACVCRYGLAKTTLEDVAKEAGFSRATLYRLFPGGREEVLQSVLEEELARYFSELSRALSAVSGLEEKIVTALKVGAERLGGHPALRFLIRHEPEVVLPRLALDGLGELLALGSGFLESHLSEHLGRKGARRVGEWIARLVVSYAICPPGEEGSQAGGPIGENDARRLVRRFVMPGVTAMSGAAGRDERSGSEQRGRSSGRRRRQERRG
jgi:AcrR family transcriptional regulator